MEHCDWFYLPLLLPTLTITSNGVMWNGLSASNSAGLIFIRSYRSVVLIMTPTTNLPLVDWVHPQTACKALCCVLLCKTYHYI